MFTTKMLDELLDQAVKRIQLLKTKFDFDLDQTLSKINSQMLDDRM